MEDGPQGYTVADGPPLRVRRHCAWGLPGRHPYRGSPEQALRTATLSPTVVRQIAADIRAGRRVDRVQIDNDGIRAKRSGREAGDFRPTIPDHLRAPEDRQANASRIDPASLRATPQLDVPERNIERSR